MVKIIKKVIFPTITSPECQCDAELATTPSESLQPLFGTVWRHHVAIADRLQTMAEDTALQPLVWSLRVWFLFLTCVILPLVLFFSVVKSSWSYGTIIIHVYSNDDDDDPESHSCYLQPLWYFSMYVSFHVNQKVHAACNFQRIIGSRRLLAVTGSIITTNN